MSESQALQSQKSADRELLYFWALGDLHYNAISSWQDLHSQRLASMFKDLRSLWFKEGAPAFCVSPGDLVELSSPENFELAKKELSNLLGKIPFYPGLGNHELYPENEDGPDALVQDYMTFWDKPVRYYWVESGVLCVMLDPVGYPEPYFSRETLTFLETALAKHPKQPAAIFAHCPLYNTVLDRDPERNLDYHTLHPFFSIQNSDEVRALLARYRNAGLYISGHTHSGWGTPNLVLTENLGGHPVTFINLMSPWYTGTYGGPRPEEDRSSYQYQADEPDVLVSFAFHIYRDKAIIQLRDHQARRWMAEWVVPLG